MTLIAVVGLVVSLLAPARAETYACTPEDAAALVASQLGGSVESDNDRRVVGQVRGKRLAISFEPSGSCDTQPRVYVDASTGWNAQAASDELEARLYTDIGRVLAYCDNQVCRAEAAERELERQAQRAREAEAARVRAAAEAAARAEQEARRAQAQDALFDAMMALPASMAESARQSAGVDGKSADWIRKYCKRIFQCSTDGHTISLNWWSSNGGSPPSDPVQSQYPCVDYWGHQGRWEALGDRCQ